MALKTVLMEQIMLLAEAGVTQFLSGMAEAVDTWSALSVLALREKNPALKLHCNPYLRHELHYTNRVN